MQQAFRFLSALLNTVSVKWTVLIPIAILVCVEFAGATIRHIPQNFPTIQSGINAAVNGDTVLVSEGTFFENIRYHGKRITVASQFLLDGDTSHISRTIINGSQPTHPDSGSVVYFINGEDTTSVLCGFTITRGTGTRVSELGAIGRAGAGILSLSGGTIRQNRIVSNTLRADSADAYAYGAGVFHFDVSSPQLLIVDGSIIAGNSITSVTQPAGAGIAVIHAASRIADNFIEGNTIASTNAAAIGAGVAIYLGPSVITNNSIVSNRSTSPSIDQNSFGGGIFVQQSPVTIESNRIINNAVLSTGTLSAVGGGICIFRNSDTAATYICRNNISGNSATGGSASMGGGLYVLTTTSVVENNLITRNRSALGGGISVLSTTAVAGSASNSATDNNEESARHPGIFLRRSDEGLLPQSQNRTLLLPSPQFINNTIANNFASSNGGGFYALAANPIILNSILYGDTAGQEILPVSSTVTVAYSNVQGGSTGEGNIDSDPAFVDSLYRIGTFSPCISAGIDSLQIGGVWHRAPRTDFFGSPRPNPAGTRPDIGSHEAPGVVPPLAPWLEQTSGFPDSGKTILSMNPVNQNVVWGLGGDFGLNPYQRFTRTTNGGTSWTSGVVTGTAGLVGSCISALDANTAYAAMGDLSFATSGGIYKTSNAGATWTRQSTAFPSAGGFVDIVHMFDLSNGVAVGDPNGGYYEIYTTANGGANWNRVPSTNIPPPLNGEFGLIPGPVFFALNNAVWFGTSQGRIYRSTNRGTNWTVASLGLDTTYFVYSIAFRDNNNGLATVISNTGGNKLLRTIDGGVTWSLLSLPPRPVASWVASVPGTSLYVLTSDFAFRSARQGSAYSSNDGASWTLIDTLEHGTTTFIAPNVGWSGKRTGAGGQGGMWKYNGNELVTSVSISEQTPNQFRLEQNYPNPFNPTTTIRFSVEERGRATLEVFNILGQKVATLFDDVAEAGKYYDVKLNGTNLASGVYLYKLQSGARSEVKKLMLLK